MSLSMLARDRWDRAEAGWVAEHGGRGFIVWPAGVRDSENWDRLEAPLVADLCWRFDGHGPEPTLHRLRH
jgi:hypothetical protein